MRTLKNIVSLSVGILILSLPFNPVKDIPDKIHLSFLFVCIFLSGIAGISATCLPAKEAGSRLTVVDLWVALMVASGIWFYPPCSGMSGLARCSLAVLYWSVRQTGGLNTVVLNSAVFTTLILLSVVGYAQLLHLVPSHHPHFDLTGPYGNPTIYAGMLCLLLSVPVVLLFHSKTNTVAYLLNAAVCLVVLPLVWLAGCRSAWIAVMVVVVFSACKRFDIPLRWKMAGCVVLVLFMGWLYHFKAASADGRLLIWKVTMQMVKEKPLAGFGPHGFRAEYMDFQSDYLKLKATDYEKRLADNNHYVYNEPLRWTVEYGLLGLLSYVAIVLCVCLYRQQKVQALSAQAVCMAGLAWGLFSYPDQVFPVLAVLAVMLAEMSNWQKGYVIKQTFSWQIPLKVFVILVIAVQGVLLVRTFRAHRQLYRMSRQIATHSQTDILTAMAQLEPTLKNETLFWPYYCHLLDQFRQDSILADKMVYWEKLYPSTHTYLLKGDVLQRMGKMEEAESAYWKAHFMVPSRQKARYKLSLLYYRQKRFSEACRLAREILAEEVKAYGFETHEIHKELRRILNESQLK